MKRAVGAAAALAMASGGLVAVGGAASAITLADGAVSVSLPKCNSSSASTPNSSDDFIPDCSYSALARKNGTVGRSLVSGNGAVTWGGSLAGSNLTFPGAQQTWPKLDKLPLGAKSSVIPSDIAGTVDASGKVQLTFNYSVALESAVGTCTLQGTSELTSEGSDPLGGGSGKNVNDDGSFAVVTTNPTKPTLVPPTSGANGCSTVSSLYDLDKGISWYLAGTMALPGSGVTPPPTQPPVTQPPVTEPVAQTAKVKLPKKIKKKGKTVILRKAVTTNAGQKAKAKVSWSTKKTAKGKSKKFATLKTTKAGKITIRTKGKAKRLYVKLRLNAPATDGYTAYKFTKTWRAK